MVKGSKSILLVTSRKMRSNGHPFTIAFVIRPLLNIRIILYVERLDNMNFFCSYGAGLVRQTCLRIIITQTTNSTINEDDANEFFGLPRDPHTENAADSDEVDIDFDIGQVIRWKEEEI